MGALRGLGLGQLAGSWAAVGLCCFIGLGAHMVKECYLEDHGTW